jgi:hypothetical protein
MAFSLTIVEGKDEGRQFTFDQVEVLIGRTSENDVVLYDPGVSRRHVKIRLDGQRYLVQDLGSANGTQVNGVTVEEEELKEGDSITVGPVVFSFSATLEVGADGGSTRIVAPGALAPVKRDKPRQLAASDVEIERGTVRRPAAKGIVKSPSGSPAKPGVPKSATLAKREKKGGGVVKVGGPATPPVQRLKDWFSSRPKMVKVGMFGGLGVVVLGVILAAIGNRGPGPDVRPSNEDEVTFVLSDKEDNQVYGNGPDVNHQCIDHCKFKFHFLVPAGAKAIATLTYYAKTIQRPDEVAIALNTVPIGFVPSTFGEFDRQQTLQLKQKYLKPNADNLVVFDNTRNPPGKEEWEVKGLKVETTELPACSRDECLSEAKRLYDQCNRKLEQIKISASNGFLAWQECKRARLQLEAVDDKENVELYNLIRDQIKDIEKTLDTVCGQQILSGKRLEELNKPADAVRAWKGGLNYFPSPEHPCYQELKDLIGKYE